MEPSHPHVIWNGTWHKHVLAESILSLKETLQKFGLAMSRWVVLTNAVRLQHEQNPLQTPKKCPGETVHLSERFFCCLIRADLTHYEDNNASPFLYSDIPSSKLLLKTCLSKVFQFICDGPCFSSP